MVLGIDFGLKHIGLATSEGSFASPLEVVEVANLNDGLERIAKKVIELQPELLVVGVSEGKSKKLAENFGKKLSVMVQLPVQFVDETLSSFEAGKSVDREKSHAKSAAIILQRYIDG